MGGKKKNKPQANNVQNSANAKTQEEEEDQFQQSHSEVQEDTITDQIP
jgi:hypothetical protein